MGKTEMVSFRYTGNAMHEAEKICAENSMDISAYIVLALLHLVHAEVCHGHIPRPAFLESIPKRRQSKKKTQAGRTPADDELSGAAAKER